MRQVVSNLEKLKLPTKHSGSTGDCTRHGSEDTARRPPSVKASLSVSFGQRAPHRASTRDSSPVRRTLAPHEKTGEDETQPQRSPHRERDRERDRMRDRDRHRNRGYDQEGDRCRNGERYRDRDKDSDRQQEREKDRDRERDRERSYDYDRRSRERSCDYDRRPRHGDRDSRHRDYDRSSRHYRSWNKSRSRSRSLGPCPTRDSSPRKDGNKEKAPASSNLAKLKDIYGDLGDRREDNSVAKLPRGNNGGEEVIRLGGSSWK